MVIKALHIHNMHEFLDELLSVKLIREEPTCSLQGLLHSYKVVSKTIVWWMCKYKRLLLFWGIVSTHN